jgi:ATP-dependent DNA helicase RecQ
MKVGLIAVDECHVITEWGKSFRPAYRNLKNIRETLPDVPIIALTASTTYNSAIQICNSLNLKTPKIFIQSFNRSNIHYNCWHKNG